MNEDIHRYDDIINLPHHQSEKRPHMPLGDRAAQFSPFAALTGHSEALAETARLTEEKIRLSEDQAAQIDGVIQEIMAKLPESSRVRVVYFVPDRRKQGGAYLAKTGDVRKVDQFKKTLVFSDQTSVFIEDILEIAFA